MSSPGGDDGRPEARDLGGSTAVGGTPYAVDLARDRRALEWLVFLAGPLIWITHFLVVYLTVEAGCTGSGPGLRAFDPPVAETITLVATAVAAVACLGAAAWARQRWRAAREHPAADDASELTGAVETWDGGGTLALAGVLLALLSFVAVLFVGLPTLVLPVC
jgi:hypothetical protein